MPLGLPPPTELIRIPERVRSADEVLEAARAARHDPRWRLRQSLARAAALGGEVLDRVEHHGLGSLARLGRHARVALWRARRSIRHLAAETTAEDSPLMRAWARLRERIERRAIQRDLLAPLPRRHTPTSDFDRAETKMMTNPYGTETGSA